MIKSKANDFYNTLLKEIDKVVEFYKKSDNKDKLK
jgi:hypothetical protein